MRSCNNKPINEYLLEERYTPAQLQYNYPNLYNMIMNSGEVVDSDTSSTNSQDVDTEEVVDASKFLDVLILGLPGKGKAFGFSMLNIF